MSSPLPVNAKQNYQHPRDGDNTTSSSNGNEDSHDRAASIARLSSSPVRYSSSPPRSISSGRSYGSTDIDAVMAGSTGLFRPLSTPTYNYEDNTVSVDLPEDQVARVVKRHLVDTTSPAGSILGTSGGNGNGSSVQRIQSIDSTGSSGSNIKSVHQLPGGAITHDIYKWAEAADMEQARRTRSQSVYIPRNEPSDPALARLRDPGGFRRYFVYDRAARQGKEPPHWMTRTFVDFLALYGHFGGEDLSDSEDEDDEDEQDNERTGLLRGDDRAARLIRRAQENAVQGTATPGKAVFLLLKAFVGTGTVGCDGMKGVYNPLDLLDILYTRCHVSTKSVSGVHIARLCMLVYCFITHTMYCIY